MSRTRKFAQLLAQQLQKNEAPLHGDSMSSFGKISAREKSTLKDREEIFLGSRSPSSSYAKISRAWAPVFFSCPIYHKPCAA